MSRRDIFSIWYVCRGREPAALDSKTPLWITFWLGRATDLIREWEAENTIGDKEMTIEINQLEKLKSVRNIEEFTEISEDSIYNN